MPAPHLQPEVLPTRTARRQSLIVASLMTLASVPASAFLIVSILKNRVDALGTLTVLIGDWIPTSLEVLFVVSLAGTATLALGCHLAPPPDRRWPLPLRVLVALALIITIPFSLIAVSFLGVHDFRILPAHSDGGCRIVIQEDWLGGTVGIVQPGSSTVGWIDDFYTDDGYDPFLNGTYSLNWHDREAHITINGTAADPAGFYDLPPTLHCLA